MRRRGELSALQTLEEKGFIRHEREGRAHRYFPLVDSEAAGASALDRIVDKVFHGSAEMLLAQPDTIRPTRCLLDLPTCP